MQKYTSEGMLAIQYDISAAVTPAAKGLGNNTYIYTYMPSSYFSFSTSIVLFAFYITYSKNLDIMDSG